ncbi:hypothetical protein B0H67DRAFT_599583 [Lasiosphaeris hirsuta]|uniref:Uncharacterized protein n=1 Tax=Lasiosphaeris hirsuta TaxID=260670 RepID=A0AA40AQD0_9PEZI|nr:hypothetical protein B0H67DRAFT_599583 [Lasiosphaeris hirsuta]
MDDNRGQRRQNEPPIHSSSNQRYHQPLHEPSQQRRSFTNTHGDRFRPAPLSTPSSGAARGMSGGSASYSTYYQEPSATAFSTSAMPQSGMGYHHTPTDYGQTDSRQTQGFAGAYNPTAIMYNVPQAAGPQSTGVYDTSQQFSSRQPAGLQMMPTDVAAPYFSSEPTNPATASAMQAQTASPGGSQVYQQPGLQNYSTSGMATMGGMAGQSSSTSDVRMEEEYPAPEGLDVAYASYQSALKAIFQSIHDGALASASESLLNVSDWLLGHVAELGLTSDDQNLHGDRIKLWNEFNYAWLSILQAQKDNMMESGQQSQRSRSPIPQDGLEKMGKELVRLCDTIERHGLVDYEYGVWEERIIAVLEECLDLYGSSASSGGGAGSTSSLHRR